MTREGIYSYIQQKYDTHPEYLWLKYPQFAIFRNHTNKKWFAILMNVSKKKLGMTSDEEVDVLNVKCDPVLIDMLVDGKTFLPAYHMNKNLWLTILLDENCNQKNVFELIDQSYQIISKVK